MFILIFLLTFFSSILLKKYFHIFLFSWKYCCGPTALPIIGNVLLLFDSPERVTRKFNELPRKYGEIVRLWFGFEFNLLLTNLKDIEAVLTDPKLINKSILYDPLRPWLRDGLLLSKGKKWAQRRKLLQPAFNYRILENFTQIFEKQSEIFIENLKKFTTKDEIHLQPLISLFTLDVICETSMGVSINAQSSNSEYVHAVETMVQVLAKRIIGIYRIDLIYKFTSLAREEEKALKVIHNFSKNVILTRRQEIIKTKISSEENEIGIKRKMNILDILLNLKIDGKPMNNLDIQEEVDNFMFTGHDTTTSTINFCLYNLAQYAEVQEKCLKEIYEIFEIDEKISINLERLNKLRYLECVIKESLRMYPPVPAIGRYTTESCTINGKYIPAGINVGISTFQLGRNEKYFQNPEKFIPERFMDSSIRNLYCFIPFSAGSRMCIAQKFAILEIKSLLVKILQNFKIELCNDINRNDYLPIFDELILKYDVSLKFRIIPRKTN